MPILDGRGALTRRRAHVQVRLQGRDLPIVLGDLSDYFVLAATRSDEAIPAFVTHPGTIVDCGAHIGTVALQYYARFPRAQIFAVEPDPATCARLRLNVRAAKNITVVQAAVAGSTGEAAFNQSRHSWTSSLAPGFASGSTGAARVLSMTLSALFDDCGLDTVDLLKLDIEGAELSALGDHAGVARVHAIVAEVHYDLGAFAEDDLLALLGGFDVRLTPYSADRALLVAQRLRPPASTR